MIIAVTNVKAVITTITKQCLHLSTHGQTYYICPKLSLFCPSLSWTYTDIVFGKSELSIDIIKLFLFVCTYT